MGAVLTIPWVSVAVTIMEYVPGVIEALTVTVPLGAVIPETVEESEAFRTVHVQEEVAPFPPETVGAAVAPVPNVVVMLE